MLTDPQAEIITAQVEKFLTSMGFAVKRNMKLRDNMEVDVLAVSEDRVVTVEIKTSREDVF
ncbi:MAG TPA: hypothetical protein VGS11_07560 [Candidatus Bathyarchaeia archaeon]|nr:hypothetical protein [Candidatus Bathyarchaeia archaeon]